MPDEQWVALDHVQWTQPVVCDLFYDRDQWIQPTTVAFTNCGTAATGAMNEFRYFQATWSATTTVTVYPWQLQVLNAYTNTTGAFMTKTTPWEWTPVTTMNTMLWKSWNHDYVEDKAEAQRLAVLEDERRRVAAHARVLAACVAGAQGQGTWLEAFAIARLDEYDDNEWHTVEDAYQRAYEVRVERDRAVDRSRLAKLEAERKAEVLLISILTAEQKREWLEHKRVTHVSEYGRIWRLFPEWAGGVCLMNAAGTERRATLCLHTVERLPEADNMAGLLLSLRHGEEERLIGIANMHQGEWSEDELQIRREQRNGAARGRRPAIHPGVLREIEEAAGARDALARNIFEVAIAARVGVPRIAGAEAEMVLIDEVQVLDNEEMPA